MSDVRYFNTVFKKISKIRLPQFSVVRQKIEKSVSRIILTGKMTI